MTSDYQRLTQAISCLSPPLKDQISVHAAFLASTLREVRLRLNRPLSLVCADKTYYISPGGRLTQNYGGSLLTVGKHDIDAAFQGICGYSVYSRQNEIINGFVTLQGGHRAGICGTAVVSGGGIVNIRDISSVNIRIARERVGCAEELRNRLGTLSGGALICGEPCSGKTTVLRDLARIISIKENKSVSLIDERGELAGTVSGAYQNDIGLCDVFDGYPKSDAVLQALRGMSPDIIMCDEIGSDNDVRAIESCVNSGAAVIATVHAANRNELARKQNVGKMIATGAFSKIVFLKSRQNAGEVSEICEAGDLF